MGKRLITDRERETLVAYLDACKSDEPKGVPIGEPDRSIPPITDALRSVSREGAVLLPLSQIEVEALVWMRQKMRVQDQGGTVTSIVPRGPHLAALRRLCERAEAGS